jgi:hypothetical protein
VIVVSKRIYKSRQTAITLLLIGLLVMFGNCIPSASAKTTSSQVQQGYVISQSSNFAGTVFSELTANALRMKVGKLGLIFIMKAPDWSAYVFNENTKNYVQLPYKEWQKKLVMTQGNKIRDQRGQIKLESHRSGKIAKICKFRAQEYVVERKGDAKLGIPTQRMTELWIASDIKAPPQVTEVFCSQLNVPAAKGIPLKAFHRTNGRLVSVLETLDVQKKALPASLFEPLKGYKRVKDEVGLMMDESTEDMVNDLLDSTGPSTLDSKTPKKH